MVRVVMLAMMMWGLVMVVMMVLLLPGWCLLDAESGVEWFLGCCECVVDWG